ncbi:hypothetical protein MLD38_001475 [Melastoma candidum]|uniref:Uncharacterized protein n=1 Tax=Melastoma candidum TaxID=119954 RepID=A0ACB9SM04_9MYRT|nr:hypothetical protein MLD38_001475 [Melastoma candidum]
MDQPSPLPPSQFAVNDHHSSSSNSRPHMLVIIDQMPDAPQRHPSHHRRSHSDTSFRFDDLLLFDPSDLDLSSLDLIPPPPPSSSSVSMSIDDPAPAASATPTPSPPGHFRSLSVDSDFFDGLGLGIEGSVGGSGSGRKGHRHSASTDGSDFEGDGIKKAMGADRMAELALIDPKRAKRILANRQSAARSKERKIRYTSELERKVQTLQTEATTLSAQVTLLQRDTTGLTAENKELKLRLQALEQQAQLRDALNEALREEVQRLKIAAGQIPAGNGNAFSRAIPRYPSHQQQQQPQFQSLSQFGNNTQAAPLQQSSPTGAQTMNGQPRSGFPGFQP